MNIINKIKSWLVSDDEILRANGKKSAAQAMYMYGLCVTLKEK